MVEHLVKHLALIKSSLLATLVTILAEQAVSRNNYANL